MSLAPFSLKNAPALIERIFPVQRLSAEVFKERKAGSGQTLTSLGGYWKGRKPLILTKACVLGCLLPVSDDPAKDLRIFELLMGMDDDSLILRMQKKLPQKRVDEAREHMSSYHRGEHSYGDLVEASARPEEMGDALFQGIWREVNQHLGTTAHSFPELVAELGIARFGHRTKVADVFSGSGQIPFAAAQIGCNVWASDLNPIANLLTWGAFNIVGSNDKKRAIIDDERENMVHLFSTEMDSLNFESDGHGWNAKVYLYCSEVVCPQTGWKVPVLPSMIVREGRNNTIAVLKPDKKKKRYDIEIHDNVSKSELKRAKYGTLQQGKLVHSPDGVHVYTTPMSVIRGDYTDKAGNNCNKLRHWESSDIVSRKDDIIQERIYAIQWIKGKQNEFRAVTPEDEEREKKVTEHVQAHLAEWQENGWVPAVKIESGSETDRLLREKGWTYWHHLFNPRQLLQAALLMKHATANTALYVLYSLDWNSKLSRWCSGCATVKNVFYNQALNTLNNYACRASRLLLNVCGSKVTRCPLPLTDCFIANQSAAEYNQDADLYITDPPYGDAVNYDEIYEFFIAWMKKNPPKEFAHWVWDSRRSLAIKGDGMGFRTSMIKAYKAMRDHMSEGGLQVLMFTHKSGAIWADLARIVWAAGLRVTASWYVVTETDCALRQGANVTGTVLLVLRRQDDTKDAYSEDIAYKLQEEIENELERLTGQNNEIGASRNEGLYKSVDLQMAGYTAALRVLTSYTHIDGQDMRELAALPKRANQTDIIDQLIALAQKETEKRMRPGDLPKKLDDCWDKLRAEERFYLKMMAEEAAEEQKLETYTNMARALHISCDQRMMAPESCANHARLKTAVEFGRADMVPDDAWGSSPLRHLLFAMRQIQREEDTQEVVQGLISDLPGGYMQHSDAIIGMAQYIAQTRSGDEAASADILAQALANTRL